ncbi:hypothetical protein HDU83_000361 [Entophlyctis luteolus]|nr:hypothetical protein HDU83_000361 [Entophlyctis luteolus]
MKPSLSLLILPDPDDGPALPPLATLGANDALARSSSIIADRPPPSDHPHRFIYAAPKPPHPDSDAPKSAPLPHLAHLSPIAAHLPAMSTSPPPPPLAAFAHMCLSPSDSSYSASHHSHSQCPTPDYRNSAEFAGSAEFRPSLDANIVYHSPSQQMRPLHPPEQHYRPFRQFPQYSTPLEQQQQQQHHHHQHRHSEEIPRPHSSNSNYRSQQFQRPQTQLSQAHPLPQPPSQNLTPTDRRLSLHKTFRMIYAAASANLRGTGSGFGGGSRRETGVTGGGLGLFSAALQLQQDQQQQSARIREFQCSMCPNRFLRKQDMKRHEVTHNQIKDFVCHNCGFGFVRRDALVRHVKSKRCMMQSEKMAAAAAASSAATNGTSATVATSAVSSATSSCVEMATTPPGLELT